MRAQTVASILVVLEAIIETVQMDRESCAKSALRDASAWAWTATMTRLS